MRADGGTGGNTWTQVQARIRAIEATRLRAQGLTYDQIAESLGFTNRSGAYKAVERVLGQQEIEAGRELRAIQLSRLEEQLAQLWPLATGPNARPAAIRRVLDIIQAECEITGLIPRQNTRRNRRR